MNLNDVLATAPIITLNDGETSFKPPMRRLHCHDGAHLSVQASSHSYCSPRSNTGPYTHVEVGYPDPLPGPLWEEYCEKIEDGASIFNYVPIHLVSFYIAAHGGLIESSK